MLKSQRGHGSESDTSGGHEETKPQTERERKLKQLERGVDDT
jgi:hypothetical protein